MATCLCSFKYISSFSCFAHLNINSPLSSAHSFASYSVVVAAAACCWAEKVAAKVAPKALDF